MTAGCDRGGGPSAKLRWVLRSKQTFPMKSFRKGHKNRWGHDTECKTYKNEESMLGATLVACASEDRGARHMLCLRESDARLGLDHVDLSLEFRDWAWACPPCNTHLAASYSIVTPAAEAAAAATAQSERKEGSDFVHTVFMITAAQSECGHIVQG